ncbi:hypothetical protein FB451DRAFT_1223993 [Mycena latifolia]|nr:hypothetical protein FB451DRAFT_1223993 [Mycena latifolia]
MRRPLKLIIRIKYASFKATDLMEMGKQEILEILRSDLDHFKLPHPPVANIHKPTKEGIVLFWKTYDVSPLFLATLRTFDIVSLPYEVRRSFAVKTGKEMDDLKDKCFVDDMTMEEIEDYEHLEYGQCPYSPPRRARSPSVKTTLKTTSRSIKTTSRRESPRRPLASKTNTWKGRHGTPKLSPMKSEKINSKNCDDEGTTNSGPNNLWYEPGGAPLPIKPENTSSVVARLVREYLDVLCTIQSAAARGVITEEQLASLGAKIAEDGGNFLGPSNLGLAEQIKEKELIIERERIKLKMAEKTLQDVLRECETPVVIPELLRMVELEDECDV